MTLHKEILEFEEFVLNGVLIEINSTLRKSKSQEILENRPGDRKESRYTKQFDA